ncbi:hypothetical protein Bca4012_035542 [Brassica carinata]
MNKFFSYGVSATCDSLQFHSKSLVAAATHLQSWIWNLDKQQNLRATRVMHQRFNWELLVKPTHVQLYLRVAAATKLKLLTGKVDKQQQHPATRLMRRRELWELTKHILSTLKTKKKLQTLP